jgi:peptide/nickel transport system permease protein
MRRFVFVVRRLLLLAFVLPAVSLLAFSISRVIPGDPVALIAGPTAKPETREALRQAWGLDKPIPVQYLLYLNRLAHGDLGLSLHTGRSVTTDLIEFFPATIELATAALLLGLPFAILGGVAAAVNKDSWIDYLIRTVIGIGISVPVFWFGILLILVFSAQLGLFPSVGRLPVQTPIPPRVTGMYTVDALLGRDFGILRDALRHLALPAFALAVTVVAPVARITRTNMLAVLRQDYIRTARAKGLPARLVIYRHALRNALLPIITSIGLVYGLLLAGAVVTETVFSWPGVGFYVTKSILALDFQPVISFTLASALIYVIINLVVDSAYVFIDPRVEVL